MSALARYFFAKNWTVSGSDGSPSLITAELNKEGLRVKIGHKKANLPSHSDIVVMSQAILPLNPELVEARRLGLTILTYPEAIGRLTREVDTLAVAGAHGKSTTTAMLAKIFIDAKLDPLVILGAKYSSFGGSNFRHGDGPFILEADEFGKAFLNYSPAHAIILNIDREHLDTYKNLDDLKNTFLKFIGRIKPSGTLILNRDDKNLFSLQKKIIVIGKLNDLKIIWFSFKSKTAAEIKARLKLPGAHNRSNALGAYTLATVLGVKSFMALRSLSKYPGLWRRMEYKGIGLNGRALIFDDYAHHPSEIKAALSGFREKYPDSPIVCVFEPHQAKRLKALFAEYPGAFKNADAVILLPTYCVPGRDINENIFTSKKLAEVLFKKYPKKAIAYLPDPNDLASVLSVLESADIKLKTIIIMMGAGPISTQTESLLDKK